MSRSLIICFLLLLVSVALGKDKNVKWTGKVKFEKDNTKSALSGDTKTITGAAEVLMPLGDTMNRTMVTGVRIAARDLERVALRIKGKEKGQGVKVREAMLLMAADLKALGDKLSQHAAVIRLTGEEAMLHQEVGVLRVTPQLTVTVATVKVYVNLAVKLDDRLDRLAKMQGFPLDLKKFFGDLRDGLKKRLTVCKDMITKLVAIGKVFTDLEKQVLVTLKKHEKEQEEALKAMEHIDLKEVPEEWKLVVETLMHCALFGEKAALVLKDIRAQEKEEPFVSKGLQGEIFVLTEASFLLGSAALAIDETQGKKGPMLLEPLESIGATLKVTLTKLSDLAESANQTGTTEQLEKLAKTGRETFALLDSVELVLAKRRKEAGGLDKKAKALLEGLDDRQHVINTIAALKVLGNDHLADKLFAMSSSHNIQVEEVRAVQMAVRKDAKALKGGAAALARQLKENPSSGSHYKDVAAAGLALSRVHTKNVMEAEKAALMKDRGDRNKVYEEFLSPAEKALLGLAPGKEAPGTSELRRQQLREEALSQKELKRLQAEKAENDVRLARRERLANKMEKDIMTGDVAKEGSANLYDRASAFSNQPPRVVEKKKKDDETAGEYAKETAIPADGPPTKVKFEAKHSNGGVPDLSVLSGVTSFLPQSAEQSVVSVNQHALSPKMQKAQGVDSLVKDVLKDKELKQSLIKSYSDAKTQVNAEVDVLKGHVKDIKALPKKIAGQYQQIKSDVVDKVNEIKALPDKITNKYDQVKAGISKIASAGSFSEGYDSAKGLASSLGAKVPLFNKVDQGMDLIEKSGEAVKALQDGPIDVGIGAAAGAGAALATLSGNKKLGKAMGKVTALSKGMEHIKAAGQHVSKLFSKAADIGAAGVASMTSAAGVIGKVIGGKVGKIVSQITSVVNAAMSASPLAIVTGAIEGLKLIGKLIPGKVGQKIGEFADIIGGHVIGMAVKGAMESWSMIKEGKIIDGVFHAAKKLNPLSLSFGLIDRLGQWMGGGVGRAVSKIAQGLTKATEFAIDTAKTLIVAPAKAVLKGLESISNAIFGKKATKAIKKAIGAVAKAVWKGAKAVGKALWKGVSSVVKGVGKAIGNVGRAIGRGLKRVFKGW